MQATATATAARTGLRALTAAEDGTSFADLPKGVFGFTYSPLSETPLFGKDNYHSFEVHKTAEGQGLLICWTTPQEADALRTAASKITIDVYPAQFESATEQVVIPFERAQLKNRNPLHDDGGKIAIHVYPN